MKKDIVCECFDDKLKIINDMDVNLVYKLKEYMNRDIKYKESKNSSILTTFCSTLICVFTWYIANDLAMTQYIATYLFYFISIISASISIGGIYWTVGNLNNIKINNRYMNSIQRMLVKVNKLRNKTIEEYNEYKHSLQRNFDDKIIISNKEFDDRGVFDFHNLDDKKVKNKKRLYKM